MQKVEKCEDVHRASLFPNNMVLQLDKNSSKMLHLTSFFENFKAYGQKVLPDRMNCDRTKIGEKFQNRKKKNETFWVIFNKSVCEYHILNQSRLVVSVKILCIYMIY